MKSLSLASVAGLVALSLVSVAGLVALSQFRYSMGAIRKGGPIGNRPLLVLTVPHTLPAILGLFCCCCCFKCDCFKIVIRYIL